MKLSVKMLLQGMTKVEDVEPTHLLPKSSSETTCVQLARNRQMESGKNISHTESRCSQPVEQRSETAVTDSTSMLTNHSLL